MTGLLDRLAALPCGAPLLGLEGAYLVGGAVRDLLLGRPPRELDVVVEGEVGPLAGRLGTVVLAHDRFGTATVEAPGGCRYDLARTRAESYARPGALPDVRPAGLAEDLRRRDVTVNAMALDLGDGTLHAVDHARADLDAGRLRVLHDRSFADDPTRLWRVARYAARLGFAVEPHTRELARAALDAGALETVSGTRIGNELRLALTEPDPVAALEAAVDLGLAPWLHPDRARAEAALALLPAGEGRADLVVLAAALGTAGEGRGAARVDEAAEAAGAASAHDVAAGDGAARGRVPDLTALGFTAAEQRVLRAAAEPPRPRGDRSSAIAAAFRGAPVEAAALSPDREAARRWLEELRHVRLRITGDDLVRAGVPHGPEVGARLRATLDRVLDGELPRDDRDAQLAAALP